MRTKKRIGVLTSGGDCPGLNAVIRGVAKASHQLGYDCVGFIKGYEGLVDPVCYVPLDQKNTTGILHQGGTMLGSTNKGRFSATVGEIGRWRALLEAKGVAVEADFEWPAGGRSIYFRDPSGNSLEFAEPRIWGM